MRQKPDPGQLRGAALDLGTNTFRLLIADLEPGKITDVVREQIITRLGGGYNSQSNILSREAIDRSLEAIDKFAAMIDEHKPSKVAAASTEIVRRARNGADFLGPARKRLGADIRVIGPDEEAALAFSGMSAYLPDDIGGHFVTLDVGGGSTEWTAAESGRMTGWVSLPLGVVELAEAVITGDPPNGLSLDSCERKVREVVEGVPDKLGVKLPVDVVVGTGGTATSLAVLDMELTGYDIERVQNHRIPLERLERLQRRLNAMTFEEKAKTFPLGGGREDVIIPGVIITRTTLNIFGANKLLVSDAGLLEGLMLATAFNSERR